MTANPRPIIVVHHSLDPTQTVPSAVNATLTFNSAAGTTWYYNTSAFIAGDIQQIALQANATSLSTGRYSYSVQVVDERSTQHDLDLHRHGHGAQPVDERLRRRLDAPGPGADHPRHRRRDPEPGRQRREPLVLGQPRRVGGNYTSPAGDFSTLTKTSHAATPARCRTAPRSPSTRADTRPPRSTSTTCTRPIPTTAPTS